ncbi:MAG: transglycosylase SLT domain-containing protein [Thermodesulfobacteriota bacterium]
MPQVSRAFVTIFMVSVSLLVPLLAGAHQARNEKINCKEVVKTPYSNDPVERYKKGYCHFKRRNWTEAYQMLLGLEKELYHAAGYVNYYSGIALMKQGKWPGAAERLYTALNSQPSEGLRNNILRHLGLTYFELEEYERAVYTFRLLGPKDTRPWIKALSLKKIGDSLAALGRGGEAVSVYKKLWLEYPESELAETALKKARRLERRHGIRLSITASDYRGRADKLFELRLWKAAYNNYRKAKQTSYVKINMAKCKYRLRRYQDSYRLLEGLSSPKAMWWKAKNKQRLGRESEAISIFASIHKTHPKSGLAADALYMAARLEQIEENYKQAAKLYDRQLRKYPKHETADKAHWQLGWMKYREGKFGEAEAKFARLSTHEGLYWRARSVEKQGFAAKALLLYKRLAERSVPSYYSHLAQDKTGIKNGRANPLLEIKNSALDKIEPVRRKRIQFFLDLGIFEDARAELAGIERSARTKRELLEASALYAHARDYNTSIRLAIRSGSGGANGLAYPRGMKELVSSYAKQYGADEHLIYSIIREESLFQPDAVSRSGAIGLMQIMPATGRAVARKERVKRYRTSFLYSPEVNIRLGISYFTSLLEDFDGAAPYALAGYNGGPHNVNKWRSEHRNLDVDEFVEEIPFRETRRYVKRVLRTYGVYKSLYSGDAGDEKQPATLGRQDPAALIIKALEVLY